MYTSVNVYVEKKIPKRGEDYWEPLTVNNIMCKTWCLSELDKICVH